MSPGLGGRRVCLRPSPLRTAGAGGSVAGRKWIRIPAAPPLPIPPSAPGSCPVPSPPGGFAAASRGCLREEAAGDPRAAGAPEPGARRPVRGEEGGAAAARPGGPGGSRLCPCPWAPPDSGRARGSRRSRSRSPGGAGWRAGGPAPAEPPAAAGCHIQAPPRGVGPGRARGGREPLFGGAGPAGSRSRSGAGRWVGAGAPRDPRRGRAGWRGPGRG